MPAGITLTMIVKQNNRLNIYQLRNSASCLNANHRLEIDNKVKIPEPTLIDQTALFSGRR